MRPAEDIRKMIGNWNDTTSVQMDERVLDDIERALEQSKIQAVSARPHKRRIIMGNPIVRLSAAAAIIAVVVLGAHELIGPSGMTSVAWADVVKRFESVPFFNVTIEVSPGQSAPGKKIQIWKSGDSRARAEEGNTVTFANFSGGERQIIAFDRSTRKPVPVSIQVTAMLDVLCPEGEFSLDTIIAAAAAESAEVVPVEASDSGNSEEVAVFEAKRKGTGEGLRIWTLRQSKLPIRMRFSDPRSGEYGEFRFEYAEKKDASFFDSEAFQNVQ